MSYPASIVRQGLEYSREAVLASPGQSIYSAMWAASGRLESIDENRRTLYEELSARIRPAGMLEQIDRALKELES